MHFVPNVLKKQNSLVFTLHDFKLKNEQ